MPRNRRAEANERAQTLETLIAVCEHQRDEKMTNALEYAREAKDTGNGKKLRAAMWQRDLARDYAERRERYERELDGLRLTL